MLKRNVLGQTGIEVSEICFGALPMGPLQKNLSLEDGASLIGAALKAGINFIDTAQMYQTYAPIRRAIETTGIRPVIASKSTAITYDEMKKAVEQGLEKLDVDYIDIFHLHAARCGLEVFQDRAGAIQCLEDFKATGVIRAVGMATHHAQVALAVAEREEFDVLFPIFNQAGKGILGGNVGDMAEAIRRNYAAGKGVYLMKVLAGGMLIQSFNDCLEFARGEVPSHAIAIGMVHPDELRYNLGYFSGETNRQPIGAANKQVLVLRGMCLGCEQCLSACHSEAIRMIDGKASIDTELCVSCGYCTASCDQFAIRVV